MKSNGLPTDSAKDILEEIVQIGTEIERRISDVTPTDNQSTRLE